MYRASKQKNKHLKHWKWLELANFKWDKNQLLSSLSQHEVAPDIDLRNFLSDQAQKIFGEMKNNISTIYKNLGFADKDLETLRSKNSFKRLRALDRIEKVGIQIPISLHERLVTDTDMTIAGLAMYHYITVHKKMAHIPLLNFIYARKKLPRGILFFLIDHYGEMDPEGLTFLFVRTNDANISMAILAAASRYRPPGFDEIIYHKIRMNSSKHEIIWALATLAHFPGDKSIALYELLARHREWEIRLRVLKSIGEVSAINCVGILKILSKDENYLVRFESCNLLTYLYFKDNQLVKDKIDPIVSEIITQKSHPSFGILTHLIAFKKIELKNIGATSSAA